MKCSRKDDGRIRRMEASIRSLVEIRPELQSIQTEIDECLDKAGHADNRLAVLEFIIEKKLKELEEKLADLRRFLKR